LLAHGPYFSVPESPAKTKSPRGQLLWYAGLKIFGIKLLEVQLFPPARDVRDATRSVACTATTHRLAGQIHTHPDYDSALTVSTTAYIQNQSATFCLTRHTGFGYEIISRNATVPGKPEAAVTDPGIGEMRIQ
jgi:hypothetical protein